MVPKKWMAGEVQARLPPWALGEKTTWVGWGEEEELSKEVVVKVPRDLLKRVWRDVRWQEEVPRDGESSAEALWCAVSQLEEGWCDAGNLAEEGLLKQEQQTEGTERTWELWHAPVMRDVPQWKAEVTRDDQLPCFDRPPHA